MYLASLQIIAWPRWPVSRSDNAKTTARTGEPTRCITFGARETVRLATPYSSLTSPGISASWGSAQHERVLGGRRGRLASVRSLTLTFYGSLRILGLECLLEPRR